MMKMWSNWNSSEVSQPVCVLLNSVKENFEDYTFFPCECQARGCYFQGENCRREKMQIMGKAGFPRKG